MSFRDLGKFDPVIWGKSYPEIGRPITANGLANSGVNSPLFHAVDAFIGMHQTSDEDELFRQQRIRRLAVLPALVRQFIEALAEPEHSVRSYVNNGRVSPCAAAAFDALVHSYIWLLEKHRIRAIGTVSIASASGRVTTAGGAQLETSSLYFSQRLNAQMMQSMASRLATRPRSMAATLVSRSPIGRRAIAVTLHFPCLLPIRAGDRVLVWPTADEDACTREECLFDGANGDPTPTTPTTPAILPVRPRHYSVSKVTQGNGRLAQQVTLSVADSEGMSVRFLRERPVGQSIRIRASPAPHFWPPAEPQTPLLLLGQGAGVGPFLGFLTERRASPTVGAIILILAARTIGDVPYLSDLEVLSQTLPLTVGLALSRDKCRILTQGAIAHQSRIMRAQDLLLHLQEDTQSLLRQGAHVYVCGSVDFGRSMRTALFTHWYLQEDRYHEECHGRATVSETRESFTLLDLAQHNQPSTIWIALGGVIYDLTPFRGTHPGGIKPLIEIAGMEADDRFRQVHSGDDAQGVIAQLSLYAIGTIEKRSMSSRLRSILRDIVDCQNVLTNNTWFASDRPVPFFVIAESLLVTSRSIARIQRGATTNNNSLTAPEDLQPIFQELKTECWTFLRDYMDISLDQKEKQVFAFYSSHWDEFHGLLQKLKHSLGSAKGDELGWLNMVFIEMIHQGFRGIRQSVERSVAALRQRLAKQRLLCLMRERSFYSNTCP
ncbi:hypothetical protein BDV35DRAFT_373877 [Aspergillus flavus]|uniref:Uncharacterized protein n=1 Tax=Aspergillus flavus TaxID=5059 RepID=A0A5N6GD60_ASPFL|nr:hypothetical protein BDV35DRAFT_373877 [Aspergillus flavus]